jgi:hypothetical protein
MRMLEAFGRILGELMERTSAILYVLDTAAQLDPEAHELLAEIRRQRHTGQSRIVTALVERRALAPDLAASRAADMVYAFMSPDVHRILTIERGWSPQDYEAWAIRCLRSLLRNEPPSTTSVTARKKVIGS